MANKIFTEDEINILKQNKYVKTVTSKYITYTEEFRELFLIEYQKGKTAKSIFEKFGFDVNMLGPKRYNNAVDRFRKMEKRPERFADTRITSSGRPRKRELTDQEKIIKLTKENIRLKQEINFLKKMKYLLEKEDLKG